MRIFKKDGFGLIELLITIAIIGILAGLILTGVSASRKKAHDNSIRNGIRQLRWFAESVYDTQAASYKDWTEHDTVTDEVTVLLQSIDDAYGSADVTVIQDNQDKDYCISAPLRSESGHYCIDATGVFKIIDDPCAAQDDDGDPLRCET